MADAPGSEQDGFQPPPGLLRRLFPPALTLPLLVAAALFMEILDGTVIATALPQMAQTFGVQPIDLGIGLTAYLVTVAAFIPVSAWTADRFGARTVFGAAIAGFVLSSMACGLSHSVWQFVAARVVQGVAGALMVPVGRLIVLRVTAKADLIRAISTLTWPALIAPVLGPPLGGFVTTYASWRWIFFFNVPIGIAGLLLTLWLVPNARGTRRPFDVSGFLLSAAGLAGLLYGLDEIARPDAGWPAWLILVVGLALCLVAVRHALGHRAPMLDLAARHIRTFAHTTLYSGNAFRVSVNSLLFLAPLLLQVGFGMTAFDAGTLILFGAAGNLGMKAVTTPVLRRFGFRPVLIVNGTLAAASIAACVLLSPGSPAWWIIVVLVAQGMTRSMQYTALNTLGFADIPKALTSGASTLTSMVQQMTTGMGVAFAALMLHLAALLGFGELAAFRFTFVVAALMCLASVPGAVRLPTSVGAALRPR